MELDYFFGNFVRLYLRKNVRDRWLDKFNSGKPIDGGALERYLNELCCRKKGGVDALFTEFLQNGRVWLWDFEGALRSIGSISECKGPRWARDPFLAVDAGFNAFYFNGDDEVFVCKKDR